MENIFEVIKGTVYPFDLLVSFNQSDEDFYSEVRHLLDDNLDKVFLNLDETVLARSYFTKNNISIVRFVNIDKDNIPHGLISHEIFHVTTFILDKANIKFSFKVDEAYAYLLGYLIDEVYGILKDKH